MGGVGHVTFKVGLVPHGEGWQLAVILYCEGHEGHEDGGFLISSTRIFEDQAGALEMYRKHLREPMEKIRQRVDPVGEQMVKTLTSQGMGVWNVETIESWDQLVSSTDIA